VQRGHGGVLVAEFVLRPDAAFAFGAVYCVYEAVATRLVAHVAGHIRVGQEPGWHARPEREHDESKEVTHSHCASAGGVEYGSSWRSIGFSDWFVGQWEVDAVACRGVVEEEDEEEDGSWDVDEGVDAVRPVHEEGMFEEPVLYGELPEDVQTLLEVDDLESMFASDVDG